MKSKIFLLVILIYFASSFFLRCDAQILTAPADDINSQFGFFIDPTFNDKGSQIGAFVVMVMNWGFVGASASNYNNLNGVGYSDLVGELGLNYHLLNFEPVRYYAGFRLGHLWRGSSGFPLAGGVVGFDWKVSRRDADVDIYLGLKLWTDYRDDQKNKFYGDSGAYKRGFLTNNPLLQENGALTVSFSF